MEIRRCSEALLRCHPARLNTLILDCNASAKNASKSRLSIAFCSRRTLSSSPASLLPQTTTTSLSAASQTTTESPVPSTSSKTPQPNQDSNQLLGNLTKTLGWTKPAQASGSRRSSEHERSLKNASSAAALLDRVRAQLAKSPGSGSDSNKFSFERMNLPEVTSGQPDLIGISQQMSSSVKPTIPMKLIPATGRTINVSRSDLPGAIRQMEILVGRNSVRKDFQAQRYHERGGLKRKRLRRERWRRNFKTGFKATIERVLELKKQGW